MLISSEMPLISVRGGFSRAFRGLVWARFSVMPSASAYFFRRLHASAHFLASRLSKTAAGSAEQEARGILIATLANPLFQGLLSSLSDEGCDGESGGRGSPRVHRRDSSVSRKTSCEAFPAGSREQSLRSAARRDYGVALRKQFDRRQLTEVVSELRTVLPTLNREVFRIKDPRRLRKIADSMGVLLKANVFKGSDGRELRGFYVPDRHFLKRPLICVNTANHPVAVAAAFWHEVGHHLTTRLLGDNHAGDPQHVLRQPLRRSSGRSAGKSPRTW